MARKSKQPQVSGRVLAKGVSVAALGLGLLAMSLVLGSNANPMLRTVANTVSGVVPYVLLLGGVLCLVGWLLRPSARPEAAERAPEWFPEDSDFSRNPSSMMAPSTLQGRKARRR